MRRTQILWGILVSFLLLSTSSFAQNGLLEKANKQYELHNFKEAIISYQRFIKANRDNIEAKGKLAISFRYLGRYSEAIRWFDEIQFAYSRYPDFIFQHAQTLKELGKYAEARRLFLDYAEFTPDVGIHFAESCSMALNKQNAPSSFTVSEEYISTDASDFGVAFFKEGVLYASSRIDFSEKSKQRDDLNQLFAVTRDFNGNLTNPQLFHQQFKGYNEGPISYSPDGHWVAITKNNFVDGVRQIPSAGLNLNIFIAEVLPNGEWKNEKFFPFNGSFSTGYPSFSPDGNALYFASDRPDGFGGFDIFVSYRTGDTWSTPENLGPTVNTQGNELTPFYDGEDLYFASDWHQGMGGLDVFRAARNGNYWDRIYNLDNQINSPKDDYGFVFDPASNIGYFVSNRDGGRGKEDIYRASKSYGGYTGNNSTTSTNGNQGTGGTRPYSPYQPDNGNGTVRTLEVVVLDEFTMRPISNAEIDFTPCGLARYYTNSNGHYTLQLPIGLDCQVIVRQQGYISGLLRVSNTSLNGVQSQQILLRTGNALPPTPNTPYTTNTSPNTIPNNLIIGKVYDPTEGSNVGDIFIKAVNQTTGQILETYTAATGEYNLTLQPNSTYLITYSKGNQSVSRTLTLGNVVTQDILGTYLVRNMGGERISTSTDVVVSTEISKGNTSTNTGLAGYSVQVSSFSSSDKTNLEIYKTLGTYGNVYNRYEANKTKVRVGVFNSREEAKAAAERIKKQGFKDAFVIAESMEGLGEGIILTDNKGSVVNTSITPSIGGTDSGKYMVRLASYRNPSFFKASKVENLGNLERRKKGPWTIMLLTGYPTLSEAIFAKNNAIKAGFSQAHIVTDDGHELKKVKF